MKMRISLVMLGVLVSFSIWASNARASERSTGNNVLVPQSRVVNDDLMAAGGSVQVPARVNGDVLAAGGNVTVSGAIRGDVAAVGGNITLKGPIGDDLRATGGNITVSAPVADNVVAAGGTVILEPGATIGRDGDISGGSIQIQGRVGRNLRLAGGDAQLASEVAGSVAAYTQHLKLLPGAVIRGDLKVYGPAAPEISPEAKVLGRVDYHKTEAAPPRKDNPVGWLGEWGFRFLWLLVPGAAFLGVSRLWTDRVAETMARQLGRSLLTGFLGLFLAPLAGVMLLFTVVGIPLAVLLLAIYGVMLLLAGAFVAYLLGGWLLRRLGHPQASPYARLALGALGVSFLMALPWIGWLVQLLVLIAGFGALVLERVEFRNQLRAHGLA